ncbi:MAG: hypothetical protein WCY01_06045 [Alkalispirochaeta sp.]
MATIRKLIRMILPDLVVRVVRRHGRRSSLRIEDFNDRLWQMYRREKVQPSPFEFSTELQQHRTMIEAFYDQICGAAVAMGLVFDSTNLRGQLIRTLPNEGSPKLRSSRSLEDVFRGILEHLRSADYDLAVADLVAIVQLRGFSQGNPFLRMRATQDHLSEVWSNGSIDGYPFIHLLDALRTNGMISAKTTRNAFSKTMDHRIAFAEYVFDILRAGRTELAASLFRVFSASTLDDPGRTALWNDSFDVVSRLFSTDALESSKSDPPDMPPDFSPVRKAIVSGMGWSGSGAVYAYLSEFADIHQVPDEFQHVSGVVSTRTLRKAAKNEEAFRQELLRFFGLTLLGFAKYESYQEYRTLALSQSYTTTDREGRYARGVNRFCRRIVRGSLMNKLDKPTISSAVDELLQAHPQIGKEMYKTILYDNIVKIYRVDEIDYVPDATLLCTFRDPRSTYVALSDEKLKFRPDVKSFIKSYRSKRHRFEEAYARVEHSQRVRIVQFEDFVSSRVLREDIARDLGLSTLAQNTYSVFQPWISTKNVTNYLSFSDQDAIQRIEAALPEYLWDRNSAISRGIALDKE